MAFRPVSFGFGAYKHYLDVKIITGAFSLATAYYCLTQNFRSFFMSKFTLCFVICMSSSNLLAANQALGLKKQIVGLSSEVKLLAAFKEPTAICLASGKIEGMARVLKDNLVNGFYPAEDIGGSDVAEGLTNDLSEVVEYVKILNSDCASIRGNNSYGENALNADLQGSIPRLRNTISDALNRLGILNF